MLIKHKGEVHNNIAIAIYRTWENFGEEKFWRIIQVKAIGKETFGR